jgi:transposase
MYNPTLAWAAKQKRLHLTFTPTHASWLNQIKIWFGILTREIVPTLQCFRGRP